ncbi:VaFE repeat-containing surface-anchored protein, partial [Peptoniphilaceae bacterium SGI.131]
LPSMKTSASNKEDGSKKLFNNTRVTVFDKVSYTNLIPGKEYTVKGKLMDKATNSPLLVDEKEVTAEKKFIAEAKEGFVEVEFIFNASELKGKKLVVFEDLLDKKGLLLSHADINDIDQTVIVNENPKTGDNINLIFNMFMSLGAIVLMLSLVFLRKETKSIKNKE